MVNRNLLLLLIFATAGCTRTLENTEIPGFYEFGIDNVKQQINVSADGKYANVLYRDGALVWSDQGSWTYEEQNGRRGVTFVKFRFGIPGYTSVPGYWFVIPEKTLIGVKEFCFDPDLDRCFQATQASIK